MAPSVETIVAFHHLHPLAKVDLPPFVENFHLKTDLDLNKKAFIFALTCFSRLSSNGLLGTVYERLWDFFVPDDSASSFDPFS
jgi:hypothetical protein